MGLFHRSDIPLQGGQEPSKKTLCFTFTANKPLPLSPSQNPSFGSPLLPVKTGRGTSPLLGAPRFGSSCGRSPGHRTVATSQEALQKASGAAFSSPWGSVSTGCHPCVCRMLPMSPQDVTHVSRASQAPLHVEAAEKAKAGLGAWSLIQEPPNGLLQRH